MLKNRMKKRTNLSAIISGVFVTRIPQSDESLVVIYN